MPLGIYRNLKLMDLMLHNSSRSTCALLETRLICYHSNNPSFLTRPTLYLPASNRLN